MCGGGGGGGSNAASLALQRQSLALSREQFEESKLQWGKQMEWQKKKSDEQKRAAEARPGKGPVRTAEYAASALGDRSGVGFGKDRLKRPVQGTGLGIT